MKTVLIYKLNGTTYRHTFAHRVSYGTVEQYLVMQKHIGISQHKNVIVDIENLLD